MDLSSPSTSSANEKNITLSKTGFFSKSSALSPTKGARKYNATTDFKVLAPYKSENNEVFDSISIPGHGFCLFWAVAAGMSYVESSTGGVTLEAIDKNFKHLTAQVIEHLRKNRNNPAIKDRILAVLDSDQLPLGLSKHVLLKQDAEEKITSYIENINENGWAGDLELGIMAELANVDIYVHTIGTIKPSTTGSVKPTSIRHFGNEHSSTKIHILHKNLIHYELLVEPDTWEMSASPSPKHS